MIGHFAMLRSRRRSAFTPGALLSSMAGAMTFGLVLWAARQIGNGPRTNDRIIPQGMRPPQDRG